MGVRFEVDFRGCSVLIPVLILVGILLFLGRLLGGGIQVLEWMWLSGRLLPKEVF